MSVKAADFEKTKQNILNNKCEFMQIQLKEIETRKKGLANKNKQIKEELKQLKLVKKKNNQSLRLDTISLVTNNQENIDRNSDAN